MIPYGVLMRRLVVYYKPDGSYGRKPFDGHQLVVFKACVRQTIAQMGRECNPLTYRRKMWTRVELKRQHRRSLRCR